MIDKSAVASVRDAKMAYEQAVQANMGVKDKRHKYRNALMNSAEALLKIADDYAGLEAEYGKLAEENMLLQQQAKAGGDGQKKRAGA